MSVDLLDETSRLYRYVRHLDRHLSLTVLRKETHPCLNG